MGAQGGDPLCDGGADAQRRGSVRGDYATLDLPSRLMSGPNRFYWTENCWMLMG